MEIIIIPAIFFMGVFMGAGFVDTNMKDRYCSKENRIFVCENRVIKTGILEIMDNDKEIE